MVSSRNAGRGSTDEHAPPANPQDYAAFVAALAQRFRGEVAAYEIWNEENFVEALRQLGIPAVFPPELALAKGLWAN